MEFIAANDLPIAEGEEVDVLCVEGGELKQKTASGLGGGVDAVIEINSAVYSAGTDDVVIPSGTYAKIMEKLMAGGVPSVVLKVSYVYGVQFTCVIIASEILYSNDKGLNIGFTGYYTGAPRVCNLVIDSNDICTEYTEQAISTN